MGYVIKDLAWSPFALLLCLLLSGVLIIVLWVAGFAFRYAEHMPLARSCSLAISAACHPPPWESNAAEQPLMYSVVEDFDENVVRHVSFSSRVVLPLVVGERYS